MKKILKEILKFLGIILLFSIVISIKTYMLYSSCGFADNFSINTIIMTFLIVTMLLSCTIFFKRTKSRISLGIFISFLLGLLLFGNRIFYVYNKTFISLFQIKSVFYANEIGSATGTLWQWQDIIYFADVIIYLIYSIISTIKYIISKNMKKNKQSLELKVVKETTSLIEISKLLTILLFILTFFFSILTFINNTLNDKSADAETSYGRIALVKDCSIWDYYFYDIKLFVTKNSSECVTTDSVVDEFFKQQNEEKEKNKNDVYLDVQNKAEGKDIYIIQLESFQNFLINKKINGKEITPNINKLANENIYFSNFHSQACISNTSDAEHSSTTSLYPFTNYSVFQFYDKYKSENIYSIANSKNYYTAYMHANVKFFWNRYNVYKNMDVDIMENSETYKDKSQYIHRWIADYNFFIENVNKIKEYPAKQNKLTYMTTVSSHIPFNLDDLGENKSKYVNIDVGEYKNTLYGDYLESANYLDTCVGAFIQKLEKEKMLDNAVIIMYGDHFGISRDNVEYREDMLLNKKLYNIDYNHTNVPCIIKIPGINEHMEIKEAKSQLDIKPTVSKFLGVEDKYSFGTNLFSKKNKVLFATGNYIVGDYIYIASQKIFKNYKNGKIYKESDLKKNSSNYKSHNKIKSEIELEKLISATIIKTNYIARKGN